eukprot:2348777-Rhodomonas_salina.2
MTRRSASIYGGDAAIYGSGAAIYGGDVGSGAAIYGSGAAIYGEDAAGYGRSIALGCQLFHSSSYTGLTGLTEECLLSAAELPRVAEGLTQRQLSGGAVADAAAYAVHQCERQLLTVRRAAAHTAPSLECVAQRLTASGVSEAQRLTGCRWRGWGSGLRS